MHGCMSTISWRIGCSGFYYREWKNIFYPQGLAQKNWFAFYAQHFNTLELNVTFYRFPTLSLFQKWHQTSPDDFLFAVKVPKIITHQKKLVDTQDLLHQFYNIVAEGLGEKTGPILFQLPPSFAYTEERLEMLLQQVSPHFTNVVEFRNNSWWRPNVVAALQQQDVSFCGVSFPGLPDDVMISGTTVYYRFHGVPKLYYSEYEETFLQKIVADIKAAPGVEKVFLLFNNTASAAALQNAKTAQQLTQSFLNKKA